MRIVIPDPIDLLEADKAALQAIGEVEMFEHAPSNEAEIIHRIQGATLMTASWTEITATIIRSNPDLRYIVVPTVGYDHVELNAATQAGVIVANCPTHNAIAVAEHSIGLMFVLSRHMLRANALLQQGKWESHHYLMGTELRGKLLCVIGYGTIGHEVAKLANALGMRVSYATSKTTSDQLDDLIAHADVVSLHLPLTPQSHYLIDQRRLQLMKPSAYLINTSRGAIVDQVALFNALKQGWIAGAALDVFEHEPIDQTPDASIVELSQLPNVVATPHIAYHTQESRIRLGQELLRTIQACIDGNPINVVNRAG